MRDHSIEYTNYLASPEWERRKVRYYSRHLKRCRSCGASDDIHLHHKTYVRLRDERDDDLIPLCESCHRVVHRLHRTSRMSLSAATDAMTFLPDEAPAGRRAQPRRRKAHVPVEDVRKVRLAAVSAKFGVPVTELRRQGYHSSVPVEVLKRWATQRPDWMPALI